MNNKKKDMHICCLQEIQLRKKKKTRKNVSEGSEKIFKQNGQ